MHAVGTTGASIIFWNNHVRLRGMLITGLGRQHHVDGKLDIPSKREIQLYSSHQYTILLMLANQAGIPTSHRKPTLLTRAKQAQVSWDSSRNEKHTVK